MQQIKRLMSAAGAALALVAVQAHAGGVDELKSFVAKVHSARGTFTQQIVHPGPKSSSDAAAMRADDNSSGTFAFARPGKFVWAYTKPYNQVLQADGQTLYVYDKDLNQVTRSKLSGAIGASPAAILFGNNDLDKNYALSDAGNKGGLDWLQMKPKSQDTQFSSIGIGFRNGVLAAMELHDVFGNVTLLTFSNVQVNPGLGAGTFRFVTPKGADVINQEQN